MVEGPRCRRNCEQFLRLQGFSRRNQITGEREVSLSGTKSSWREFSPNGHHKEENPLENTVVYQAQTPPGENGRNGNGRKPTKISGEIKIPSEVSV